MKPEKKAEAKPAEAKVVEAPKAAETAAPKENKGGRFVSADEIEKRAAAAAARAEATSTAVDIVLITWAGTTPIVKRRLIQ